MGQLLRIAIILLVLWLLWRAIKRLLSDPNKPQSRQPSQKMLACQRCGTFLPESQAVMRNGKPYCSPEHADNRRA